MREDVPGSSSRRSEGDGDPKKTSDGQMGRWTMGRVYPDQGRTTEMWIREYLPLNKINSRIKAKKVRKKSPSWNNDKQALGKKKLRHTAETSAEKPDKEQEKEHRTEVLNPPRSKGLYWAIEDIEKLVQNVINSNNQFYDIWESWAPEDRQKFCVVVGVELAASTTCAKSEEVIYHLLNSYGNATKLKCKMDSRVSWEEERLNEKENVCREENLVVSKKAASEEDDNKGDDNVGETENSPETSAKMLTVETPPARFEEKQQLEMMGKQEEESEDGHVAEDAEAQQSCFENDEDAADRQSHVDEDKDDGEDKDDNDEDGPVVDLTEKWEDEEKENVEPEESVSSTAGFSSDPDPASSFLGMYSDFAASAHEVSETGAPIIEQTGTPKAKKVAFQGQLKNRETFEQSHEEEEVNDVIPETMPCPITPIRAAVFEEIPHVLGQLEGSAPKRPKGKDLTIIALCLVAYALKWLKRSDKLKLPKDEKSIEKNPEPKEDCLPSSFLTGSPAEHKMTSPPNNLESDLSSAYKAKVKRRVKKKKKKASGKRREAEDIKTGDHLSEKSTKACCVDEAPLPSRRKSSGSWQCASYKIRSATGEGAGQGCHTNHNNNSGTGQAAGGDGFQSSWRGGGGSGGGCGGRNRGGGGGDEGDDDKHGRREMSIGGKEPADDYKAPKKKTSSTKHGELKHNLEATLDLLSRRHNEVQSWQEDNAASYLEIIQEMTKCFPACLSTQADQCDSCTLVVDLMRHLASCRVLCKGKCLPALEIIQNHVSVCIEYSTTCASNQTCRIEICQEIVSLYSQHRVTKKPVGLAEFLEKDVALAAIRAQLQCWPQVCNQESQERPVETQKPQGQPSSLPVPGVCGPPADIFIPEDPASNTVQPLYNPAAAAQHQAVGQTQTSPFHTREPTWLPQVNRETAQHTDVTSGYRSLSLASRGDTSSATPSVTRDNEGEEFTEQGGEEGLPVFHKLLRATSDGTLTNIGSGDSVATLISRGSGGPDASFGEIPASDDFPHELRELDDSGSDGNLGICRASGNVSVSSRCEKDDLLRFASQLERKKLLPEAKDDLSEGTQMRGVVLRQYEKLFGITQPGGRYDLRKEWDQITALGAGRFSVCFLAIDNTTKFKFVIKRIPHYMFRKMEVLVLGHLDHPNIVKLYGILQGGDYVYLLMEFVDGDTLHTMIDKELEFPALEIHRSLLTLLSYLEERGVIHNDIKADNILVRDGTFEIVLIDYGLAVMLDPPATRTAGGEDPVGAYLHCSPEKARSESYDHRSDVWAAHCTLKHSLTGRYVWTDLYPDLTCALYIISTRPPPVQEVRTLDLPDDIVNLFELGWTADCTQRPSARELLQHPAFLGAQSMEVSLEEDSAEGDVGGFSLVARDASCLPPPRAEEEDPRDSLRQNLDTFHAEDEPDVAVTRAKRLMYASEVQPREEEDAEIKEEAAGLDAALEEPSSRDTTVGQGVPRRPTGLLTSDPRHATPVHSDIPVLELRPRRRQYIPADEHIRILQGLQSASTQPPQSESSETGRTKLPRKQSTGRSPSQGSDQDEPRQAPPADETSVQKVWTRPRQRPPPFIPRLPIFDEDDNNNYCGARPKVPAPQRQPTRVTTQQPERQARNQTAGVGSQITSPNAKSGASSASSLRLFDDGNGSRSAGVITPEETAGSQQGISLQASISPTRSLRRDGRQWYRSDSCVQDEDYEKPASVLTETDSAAADSLEILTSDTSTNYHLSLLEILNNNSSEEDVDPEVQKQFIAELEEQLPSVSPEGLKVRFSAMSGKILAEILLLEVSTDTWEDILKMAAEKIHAEGMRCFTAFHVGGQHLDLQEQLSIYLSRGDNAIEVLVLPVATGDHEEDASLGSHQLYETNWQWRMFNGNIETRIRNDNQMAPRE